mmetsp:Transcript_47837/g.97364  ORF Transcript_47837/g.97364 Transcript_47837/m.97364 type:complete len:206 (+) Transcript_47837:82-699(+)
MHLLQCTSSTCRQAAVSIVLMGVPQHAACLQLAAVRDLDLLGRLARARAKALDLLDNVHAVLDLTKHNVLAVQPARHDSGDEKLRAVGVGTSVGHGQQARAGVLHLEVLVGKLHAVDGLATSAVEVGEVTALEHEVIDDTVEDGALVGQRLAARTNTLLAGAQAAEVLGGLGHNVAVQLERDATQRRTIGGDVEEHDRAGHLDMM